jgi:hypothetical protein
MNSFTIDCDECVMQHTVACRDCVVTHLLDRQRGQAVVVDMTEVRALRLLADAGLAAPLRHRAIPPAERAGGRARR